MSIMTNPSVEKETPNLFPIRLMAVAGLAAAAILCVNAAKRAGLIEITAATSASGGVQQKRSSVCCLGQPCTYFPPPVEPFARDRATTKHVTSEVRCRSAAVCQFG